jgi:hypothetical protein
MGVTMRRLLPGLLTLAAALFLGGCGAAAPRTTSLRVQGQPGDASVTVDERYLGALAYVARRGVAMPPGKHRITVEKAGYFPWDRLVEAHEGDPPVQLDVTLVKIPD